MNWLRAATVFTLFVVAFVLGGTLVRLTIAVGEPQTAATMGLVALLLVVAAAFGVRGREWLRNPYW